MVENSKRYKHIKTNDIYELVKSGNGFICVIKLLPTKDDYNIGSGRIFKGDKRTFKKSFKKASAKDIEKANVVDIPKELRSEIVSKLETDIYFILNHTDEYIEQSIIQEYLRLPTK